MTLVLRVVSKPPGIFLPVESKSFQEEGGNIGRAEHCDFRLLDEQHFVSKIHALIHYRDQMYFMTDVSSNGVFVNKDTTPIGKGNTKKIMEGDRFRMGGYILQASYQDAAIEGHQPIMPKELLSIDDDLEQIIKDSHSIDDLLAPEIEINRKPADDLFNASHQNIDELLASLEDDKELLEMELLNDDGQDMADFLSPRSTSASPQINVLGDLNHMRPQKNAEARKVFQLILQTLERESFARHFNAETLGMLREQLLAHQEQILKDV